MNEPKIFRAIMLSSTFTDLEEHRQKAIEAIAKYGYMPRVMEFSGARAGADVIETSLQMVRDAAAYVGVIGQKYGQTPNDGTLNPDGLSITELEFNEAMRLGRPIILFIMGDKHRLTKADFEADPGKTKKLDDFRERAKLLRSGSGVQRVYEIFESLEDFSNAAAIAIGNLVFQLGQSVSSAKPVADIGARHAISNIPITVPRHFLGRGDDLAAIDAALKRGDGRAAVTALYGLRGVGKTSLAAAYAERHQQDYRATWWIRAETDTTIRADLVGLGVQLKWVTEDIPEEAAVKAVLDRLPRDGRDILLVYDNARTSRELASFLPRGAGPHIIITANAPDWGGVASPVEIEVWPEEVGAEFLIARTGRTGERDAGVSLSIALGGLPLAHEQAAAYCERLGMSLSDYATKFANAPGKYLDAAGAPAQYHNGLTVSRTFALAIDEAAKLHKAAEVLITYAALLAPEPIPLFLFTEGHEEFSEPLASALAGDGLDEAVGALRAFSLLDRESIPDERDPSITTDTIRLHRLVREVAVSQTSAEARADIHCELIVAAARVYPSDVHRNAAAWPRARRLDVIALALVGESDKLPEGSEISAATLLSKLDSYRDGALAAFSDAQKLAERALAIRQKVLGADHPDTATSLNNIGGLLLAQSDLVGAWSYYERALAINEKALGPDHPATALGLNNLGYLLRERGNFAEARTYYERAVAINEKVFGRDHPDGALSLSNLGALLQAQGDLVGAQTYCERALAIREKEFGPDHPDTALSLNNLGALLVERGDLAGARPYYERALAIREKVLGSDHPDTAMSFNNLGTLLDSQGDLAGARPKYERAVAINEKVLGSDHPDTALSLNNLGYLLQTLGDHTGARRRYEAALSICDNKLGLAHRTTRTVAWNLAGLLDELGLAAEAEKVRQKFGV